MCFRLAKPKPSAEGIVGQLPSMARNSIACAARKPQHFTMFLLNDRSTMEKHPEKCLNSRYTDQASTVSALRRVSLAVGVDLGGGHRENHHQDRQLLNPYRRTSVVTRS